MKKSNLDPTDSLDFRFLDSASHSEIEAACLYEYMRESQMLRDALKREDEWRTIGAPYGLRSPFFLSLTEEQSFCLMLELKRAGFPRPWKKLSAKSRKLLVLLLSCLDPSGDNESYSPVMIEQGMIEFAPCVETADRRHHWRLESARPSLLKSRERFGRKYFYGIIQIEEGCNETEAVEGFRDEFCMRWEKTKSGGGAKWRDRLNQLAVIRIWKHEHNQWKRLKLVAKFCGYKGCIEEADAHKKRCKEGDADEPMGKAAKVEISRARSEARKFFQILFPGEEPLSY